VSTWAFDNGLSAVDFLCGAEAFKLRFATQTTILSSLVGAGSWRGRLAIGVDEARHEIGQWRELRAKTSETIATE
jgi:CelD/BcsL family acetyltransferase involved in cellulose biosynthesis